MNMTNEFHPPARILMGPGPSNVDPRVLLAMAKPMVGHLDPEFLRIMNNIQDLLRQMFGTKNALTIPISGTGSAGMEAAFVNVVEPGDRVLIGINGVFGERMSDVAERCGANLRKVSVPWGKPLDLQAIQAALDEFHPRVLAVVHAETSTGVLQPLEDFARILKKHPDTLLLVDTVTSMGGHPVKVDAWGIDICYSGTQKCLSCPPGLAPITFSARALEKIRNRSKKVQSWYLDMNMVGKYWGNERTYHHTAPISMNYALLEALRIIDEEGLEARHARHRRNHLALARGVEAMGLRMPVEEPYRLSSLNAVGIPPGIDDGKIRKRLLEEYNLEIGGGLGELKGKIWRVGLMGYGSSEPNVLYFLTALEQTLRAEGFEVPPGSGAAAAKAFYSQSTAK
jgi:alanine-glyoxylate transaminase / serine-glyoxylate transaminase / serine-pyruvate transaminase